jgi:hypothetical protein
MRILILLFAISTQAANHYVRSGASGAGSGVDWIDAYTALPATLTRGDTYYVAAGTYSTYTFDDAESGTDTITIKKATVADHGTETGWDNGYAAQAEFATLNLTGPLFNFTSGYYVLDGNGTHTAPSKTAIDYGFKLSSMTTSNNSGMVAITSTNVTLRYAHIYNAFDSTSSNNATVGIRLSAANPAEYVKIQNVFLENTGKDGIQINDTDYLLIEQSYFKRLAMARALSPDYHGQVVAMIDHADNIVIRNNIWESGEGQAIVAYGGPGKTNQNIRFYGNIVFNPYNTTSNWGFPSSGGIVANAWEAGLISGVYCYNNSIVNITSSYSLDGINYSKFRAIASNRANLFVYNNLYYNCSGVDISAAYTASHMAAGGGSVPGKSNEQTGWQETDFDGYAADNFELQNNTTAGLDLTGESWWDDDADVFFGALDQATDMQGRTRTTWSRGAFEYVDHAPTISAISNQSMAKNGELVVEFTVSDDLDAAGSITPTVDSSDQAVMPLAGIFVNHISGTTWEIQFNGNGVEGTSTITVTAEDSGALTDEIEFMLSVNAVPYPAVTGGGRMARRGR